MNWGDIKYIVDFHANPALDGCDRKTETKTRGGTVLQNGNHAVAQYVKELEALDVQMKIRNLIDFY